MKGKNVQSKILHKNIKGDAETSTKLSECSTRQRKKS
jgi:hypothetical protein